MNLFNHVRQSYGQSTVKHLRDLENCEKKIQRHRNHLVYSLRCRDQKLTPPSLKLRCPVNTNKAKDIIKRAEKGLIRERIRVVNNKIKNLKAKKDQLKDDVNNEIPAESDLGQKIERHLATVSETTYQDTKRRHLQKLEILTKKAAANNKKFHDSAIDLSGSQLKKWVVNLSKYKLNAAQTSVLTKGLNYAISPPKIPAEEFVLATELACKHLPLADGIQLRAKVASTLKSSKVPEQNVTKEERKAIKDLKKAEDIIILPADKGKSTVVLDRVDYDEKVNTMLGDKKTYEELPNDPTAKYKRKLVSALSKLKKEGKITETKYKQLYPTAENVPRLYCTPIIHKPNTPLRPIVDYTATIGYSTSRWLADILGGLVGNTQHHVKNSQQLAEDLAKVVIEEEDILNSHDVVSLFTNTPIDQVLEIVRNRLENENLLRVYNKDTGFKITSEDVVHLLEFILTTTYFTFKGKIYRQLFGTAMGSPVSPIAANIFMEALEQQAIATAPLDCRPKLWLRYVDDILEVIQRDSVQQLTDHINQVDKSGSIKFTFEQDSQGQIPFLDTLIVKKDDGTVKLLVYRKPTHTDQYLNYQSHHPLHQKLGVVRTLYNRKDTIVTEEQDKEEEEKKIQEALQTSGYPKWSFEKVKDQMQSVKPKKSAKKTDDSTRSRGMVVLPYVKGVTERVSRVMKKYNVSTAMKPHNTLRRELVHPKDKRDPNNLTQAVYKIPCLNCDLSYIGETGRKFGTRLEEHRKEVEKVNSTVVTRAEHLAELFGNRLIALKHEVEWPLRSLDRTPLDFYLWGYLQSRRGVIRRGVNIMLAMWKTVTYCKESG
ncbi:uncharacterized protein [Amphiura filiformis]|uniref:uncharacterized protein n=1 Tax=Amphiura filiformis TaxID=82378 RepID=UPI003B20EB6E